MAVFNIVWIGLLGHFMHRYKGHYHADVLFFAVLFLVPWTSAVESIRQKIGTRYSAKAVDVFLAIVQTFFVVKLFENHRIMYGQVNATTVFFQIVYGVSLILSLLILKQIFQNKRFEALNWALVAIAMLSWIAVPYFSPSPHIDVFSSNTSAVDYLFKGENPYSGAYSDIYAGEFDYKAGFLYWPGLLSFLSIGKFFGGDIRYGLILAKWLFAAALFLVFRSRLKLHSSRLPLLVGIWVTMPVNLFVIEQSWTDMALLACFGGILYFVNRNRYLLAYVCAAVACSVKQYGAVFAIFLFLEDFKNQRDLKGAVLRYCVFLVSLALILAPFVLWNPSAFFDMTILNHINPSPRYDAFNITSLLWNKYQIATSAGFKSGMSLLGFIFAAWVQWNSKSLMPAARWALACFIAFSFSFLFGKYAFCNYYYFLFGLYIPVVWGFLVELEHEPRPKKV